MRNGWNRMGLGLAAAVFLLGLAAAEEAPAGADERMGRSYVLMTQAGLAWQAEDRSTAQARYNEALALLEGLERDYPGWYTQVVRHRLLACESALVQIREGRPAPLPGGADPVEPEPAAEIGGAVRFGRPGVDDPAAWRALQAGLAERDALVEELRGEIRELKEQVRRLTQERDAALGVRESPVHVPAALRAEARRHLESGGVSNAVALLEETCRLRPDDEAAAHLLAAAYCRIGDYEAALRLAQPLARRLGRRSPDIWMTIGVAQLGLGNLGRSRVAFETALERDPGLAEAHFNLVQILIRLDPPDAEGAAARYEAARMAGAARDPDLESIIRQLLLARQVRQLK